MTFHRLRQPLTLWFALLIAVFGAFAPTRSHPHVGSQGEVLAMAVCTSAGMCWLQIDPPPPDASASCSAQAIQAGMDTAPTTGRIWDLCWNGEQIALDGLGQRFATEAAKQPQPEVHIRADRHVYYEKVAQVIALAAKAGLVRIGFVSEPTS